MKLNPKIHLVGAATLVIAAGCVGAEPSGGGGAGNTASGTSNGGSNGASSASSSSSGWSGCDVSASACNATIGPGAITLCANYVSASVLGNGGYAYPYADTGGSTACMPPTALCAAGVTAAFTATTNPNTTWGAGISITLNQAQSPGASRAPEGTYAVPGNGVRYSLTSLPPQGLRFVIDDAGTQYCATLHAASGTALWSQFNTKCWDGTGAALTHAPATATTLNVQVVAAGAMPQTYDFCLTSIAFSE